MPALLTNHLKMKASSQDKVYLEKYVWDSLLVLGYATVCLVPCPILLVSCCRPLVTVPKVAGLTVIWYPGRNFALMGFRMNLVLLVLNFKFDPLPKGLDSMKPPYQKLLREPKRCYVRLTPL